MYFLQGPNILVYIHGSGSGDSYMGPLGDALVADSKTAGQLCRIESWLQAFFAVLQRKLSIKDFQYT